MGFLHPRHLALQELIKSTQSHVPAVGILLIRKMCHIPRGRLTGKKRAPRTSFSMACFESRTVAVKLVASQCFSLSGARTARPLL